MSRLLSSNNRNANVVYKPSDVLSYRPFPGIEAIVDREETQ